MTDQNCSIVAFGKKKKIIVVYFSVTEIGFIMLAVSSWLWYFVSCIEWIWFANLTLCLVQTWLIKACARVRLYGIGCTACIIHFIYPHCVSIQYFYFPLHSDEFPPRTFHSTSMCVSLILNMCATLPVDHTCVRFGLLLGCSTCSL